MATKRNRKAKIAVAITLAVILIILAVAVWYVYKYENELFMTYYNALFGDDKNEQDEIPSTIIEGDLTIHFIDMGNEWAGDCVYIKAGDTDMLVDAGSRAGSVPTIRAYLDNYVTDGVLEYVIATHADRDHIAGFAASTSIFDIYECETIIDFPRTDKDTATYEDYVANRDAEVEAGAVHYTALECYNEENGAKRVWNLSEDVTMTILYQEFYENSSPDENNYSVCFILTHGERHFLFTGDLEKEGEQSLVEHNNLPEVVLFKAGHHGSPTSSNDVLLSVIKPKIVCVCCCAGCGEYTANNANTFPSQAMIDRVAKYTDRVYVLCAIDTVFVPGTDDKDDKLESVGERYMLNGNIAVTSSESEVSVNCSNNNTLLKDTEWFKNNRETPPEWEAAA